MMFFLSKLNTLLKDKSKYYLVKIFSFSLFLLACKVWSFFLSVLKIIFFNQFYSTFLFFFNALFETKDLSIENYSIFFYSFYS